MNLNSQTGWMLQICSGLFAIFLLYISWAFSLRLSSNEITLRHKSGDNSMSGCIRSILLSKKPISTSQCLQGACQPIRAGSHLYHLGCTLAIPHLYSYQTDMHLSSPLALVWALQDQLPVHGHNLGFNIVNILVERTPVSCSIACLLWNDRASRRSWLQGG